MEPPLLLNQLSLQTQLQTLTLPLGQFAPWSEMITPDSPLVLYRVKQVWPIVYRSPLLQQILQQIQTCDRNALVAQLLEQLPSHPDWQHQVDEAHCRLAFQWRPGAIASYLQSLWVVSRELGAPSELIDLPLSQLSPEHLQLQYAHGRCCSLLALAQRQGLAIPQRPDWLSLNSVGDRAFFSVWLTCGDRLALGHEGLKPMRQLTDAWQGWYAQSQIWGTTPAPLAQTRLALIALMQRLLGWYLQQYCGLEPWRST